ncbi:MAG: accessory gene regulator B family protein [Clostridia bacterium]|nr:accessory gene regulator B family protein [Clostridia bacterium]
MLSRVVNDIAQFFYKNDIIKEDDIEVYAYGLEILLSSVLNVLAVLLISVFVSQFWGTIAFLIAFIPLRTYAGGYHADTHLSCFLILLCVYIMDLAVVLFMPEQIKLYLFVFGIAFSLLLIVLFAPLDDENKPITETEREKYRKVSIFILAVQIIVSSSLFFTVGISDILMHFIVGQLAASSSLMFAKIKRQKKGR